MTRREGRDGAFLRRLVAELDGPDTVGLLLTGSRARGEGTPYSDWDIVRLTVRHSAEENTLPFVRSGQLVTVVATSIARKRREIKRPETAIWAVPGLRQGRVLLDKDGSVAALQQAARTFTWARLERAADEYTGGQMAGYTEEVQKVLGGMARRDESAVLYATLGLLLGMTRVVAVHKRLLISSENAYFRQVQESAGADSAWTRWHRLAAGSGDAGRFGEGTPPAMARGEAAIRLYEETAVLLAGRIAGPPGVLVRRALRLARGMKADGLVQNHAKKR